MKNKTEIRSKVHPDCEGYFRDKFSIRMKCITYSNFGPSSDVLKLEEFPNPEPKDGEVLVKLHFSGVNPSDAKARAGNRPGILKPQFDVIIPNSDGSGEIIKIGNGVNKKRIGQKVWIWNDHSSKV